MNVSPGVQFDSIAEIGDTGLVGAIAWKLVDADDGTVIPASTDDIAENPAGSGVYVASRISPAARDQYIILWSTDGSFTPDTVTTEELDVGSTLIGTGGAAVGVAMPCQSWIAAADVAECCGFDLGSENEQQAQISAEASSGILYQLSGRRYSGTCELVVRPVPQWSCWMPVRIEGQWWRLSRVRLAGYVTSIIEVLIDGDPVDPSLYRLDEHRWLTRMADPDGRARSWPTSPRFDLPATEVGTFQITYEHGLDPPLIAFQAASALACELYRACPGNDATGDCQLPSGVKRIVRQGITIETVSSIAAMLRKGATGIVAVDSFLAAYGRTSRASAVWSPDVPAFPRPEGIMGGELMAAEALHALAVAVLDAAEQTLATTDGGTPPRSFVCHGDPALDCCDQLAVNVIGIGEAAVGPVTAMAPGQRHRTPGRVNLTGLNVTLTRCYPVVDEDALPSPADQQAATAILNADGWALWNGLYRMRDQLFASCDSVFFDALTPLPPQGGCAGWVFQIRLELAGYDPEAGS